MTAEQADQEQMTFDIEEEVLARNMARKMVYSFISAAISDPHFDRADVLFHDHFQEDIRRACVYLATEVSEDFELGAGEQDPEQLRAEPLLEELEAGKDALKELNLDIFGHTISKECPPYELEYLERTDLFYRSRQLSDIAGFYRAFGLEKSDNHHHRADHLTLETEFMSFLISKRLYGRQQGHDEENLEICRDAETSFYEEHLHWWLPSVSRALASTAKDTFYGKLGTFLSRFSAIERDYFDRDPAEDVVEPTTMEYDPEDDACGDCSVPASKMAVDKSRK